MFQFHQEEILQQMFHLYALLVMPYFNIFWINYATFRETIFFPMKNGTFVFSKYAKLTRKLLGQNNSPSEFPYGEEEEKSVLHFHY